MHGTSKHKRWKYEEQPNHKTNRSREIHVYEYNHGDSIHQNGKEKDHPNTSNYGRHSSMQPKEKMGYDLQTTLRKHVDPSRRHDEPLSEQNKCPSTDSINKDRLEIVTVQNSTKQDKSVTNRTPRQGTLTEERTQNTRPKPTEGKDIVQNTMDKAGDSVKSKSQQETPAKDHQQDLEVGPKPKAPDRT